MAEPLTTPNIASEMALLADRCVQCGLCLPHCPTYQLDRSEPESPRGRISYMKSLALGQIEPTEKGDGYLDHCLGCRRCETACPANVEYGVLLGLAREQQFLRKPPPLKTRIISGLLVKPAMLGIAGILGRLEGRLPSLPMPGSAGKTGTAIGAGEKVAIFAGCMANTYEASTRINLERILNALGFSIVPVTQQTCCGTAALHLGDRHTVDVQTAKNRAAFSHGITVLSLATGCHEQLSQSLQAQNKVVDAIDFIFRHADRLKFKAANRHIALHIPCTQSALVKSDDATRRLLSMIPCLQIHELPDRGCCGAAGLHMLTEPVRASQLRAPLLAEVTASEATELLSANIGCRLHLANGLKIPVRHPIDFLAEHLA